MSRFILRRLAVASLLLWSFGVLAEHYTVPLLVPAGTSSEPQGVVRILNGTDESGTVEIYAIDDAGTRSGPATFTLNASAAVQFTATDLAAGNATLGLTGGIGTDVGDARLQIETDLAIVPLAFVRAADGTLSAMHDTVRGASVGGSDGYTYEVPIFNPASDATQVSRLRLINPGDAAAAVTIGGRDDSGAVATGGDVTLMLAAGGAQTLTAQQLEAGDTAITGQLGAGTGKWRLTVSSDQPLQVVNIVAATAGYWNNLSTTAAPGAAPADLESLNERFVGNAVVYVTGSSRVTLNAQTGERFTETAEIDGVSTTYMGSYGYSAIGPDAGRLTVTYDDGDVCAANLYFSTHTAGWFASHFTGTDYPADGTWLGGSWSVEEDEDDGGEVVETSYGVDDALPGVPTSGLFIPSVTSGGRVAASGAGTTIELNNGGYFELSDGTRYTCTATGGCAVTNGTVTRGTVAGRPASSGEVDRFPSFRTATGPGAQTYTVGTAIDALTLPEASGGNGTLTYSLTPNVPGLSFNASTRQLTGTPSTAGTYAMTYTVTDEDDDTDTLSFTITVNTGTTETGSLGECYVSLSVSIGQSCTYPGTTDAFSVNERGRGSFLTFLAGIRIRIDNATINGRVYDLLASHQGSGVWRIDRIAGSTEVPETPPMTGGGEMEPEDTSPSFAADAGPGNQTYTVGTSIATLTLPEASSGDGTLSYSLSPDVPGLTFNATTRQLTGTPTAAASYNMTYTVTDGDGDTDTLSFSITVEDSEDNGDATGTGYGVGDALPGVPTGFFLPSLSGSVSVVGTTITFGLGGSIELDDGTRYTCTSPGGCTLENGTVTRGTLVGGDSSDSIAPADEQSFNSLVVGNRFQYSFLYLDFLSAGRSTLLDGLLGSYTYASTGSDTGTLTLTFDGGGSCTYLLTFVSETAGTHSRTCTSLPSGQGPWTITSTDVPPAPGATSVSGSNTSLRVRFFDSFEAGESRAYDYQFRGESAGAGWGSTYCLSFANDSNSAAKNATVDQTAEGFQPATVYQVRYRYRNSGSCESGSPGSWSIIGEGRTGGGGQGLGFSESGSAIRSIAENLPGGINVGVPVSAADDAGNREPIDITIDLLDPAPR